MDEIRASFCDAVFEDGYMWVFDNLIQAICKIDIATFKMEIVSFYKGKEIFIVQKILLYQNKFYMSTISSAKILIYDREMKGKKEAFCLQKPSRDGRPIGTFFIYADALYFLPRRIDEEIIYFDIITKKYYTKNFLESDMINQLKKNAINVKCYYYYENTVWFVLQGTCFYFRYSMEEEKVELFQTQDKKCSLEKICYDGECVWLTESEDGNVICEGERLVKIPEKHSYSRLYFISGWIVILPKYGSDLVLIEKETFQVSLIELPLIEKEKQQKERGNNFLDCKEYHDFVFLFPNGIQDMFVFHKKTLKVKRVKLKCENYTEKCFQNKKIQLCENEYLNLKSLLQFSEQSILNEKISKKEKKNVGIIAWETLANKS